MTTSGTGRRKEFLTMAYTMEFFDTYTDYRKKLKDICADTATALVRLEKYKGSNGYAQEVEKVTKKKEDAVKALQNEYRPRFMSTINSMNLAARKIKAEPPTEEEIRILTLLKMREDLTRDEAQAIANSLSTSGAVDIFRENIMERGIVGIEFPHVYRVTVTQAKEAISALRHLALKNLEMNEIGPQARAKWALSPAYHPDADPQGPRGDLFGADRDFIDEDAMLSWVSGGVDKTALWNALNG